MLKPIRCRTLARHFHSHVPWEWLPDTGRAAGSPSESRRADGDLLSYRVDSSLVGPTVGVGSCSTADGDLTATPAVIAYVLWKTLEQWQQRAGPGNSPRTILEKVARIQSTDIVLPLADGSGREMRIRCIVRPDRAQAALLDRLGLELPERLRIPPVMARM